MQVQPRSFTGNAIIGTPAFTGTIISPLTGTGFQPAYTDSDSVNVPAQPQRIAGMAYTGFTKVVLYNGSDNTGDVVAVGGAAGTYSWSYEVNCQKGLYVEVTGTGAGTVWLV